MIDRAMIKSDKTVVFTEIEQKLIDLIPIGNEIDAIDSESLTKEFYKNVPDMPFFPRKNVTARLRTIAEKAEFLKKDWRLMKTYRAGPNPQLFWREKVK